MRQWGPHIRAELASWLSARPTLPFSDEVARTWGEISTHAATGGRPVPRTTHGLPPAVSYGLPPATLNTRTSPSTRG
jgi:hypothetical protein